MHSPRREWSARSQYSTETDKLQRILWIVMMLGVLGLSACSLRPSTVTQSDGLPTLQRLDWGAPAINQAQWSPNGRWIAIWEGSTTVSANLYVVSPDGKTRINLRGWNCDPGDAYGAYSYAWLPDNSLSCWTTTKVSQLCIGSAPFKTCRVESLDPQLLDLQTGGVWTPDGQYLLMSADQAPNADTDPSLYVVTRQGIVTQVLPFPNTGIFMPTWAPCSPSMLAYYHGSTLVMAAVAWHNGRLTLGPEHPIVGEQYYFNEVARYAWDPTGAWVAVRYANYRGGDKIYLINPHNPAQTVDVVHADLAGQQMMHPIWSPDGKTLIVFGVNDSQPYAINIAAYLKSKGLPQ